MANFQQILNDEIRRLARKETSGTLKELKAQLVELRRVTAELNRRLKALESNMPNVINTHFFECAYSYIMFF